MGGGTVVSTDRFPERDRLAPAVQTGVEAAELIGGIFIRRVVFQHEAENVDLLDPEGELFLPGRLRIGQFHRESQFVGQPGAVAGGDRQGFRHPVEESVRLIIEAAVEIFADRFEHEFTVNRPTGTALGPDDRSKGKGVVGLFERSGVVAPQTAFGNGEQGEAAAGGTHG